MPGFLIPQTSASPLTITDVFVVNSEAAMLALSSAQTGDVAVRTDLNKSFILSDNNYSTLSSWKELLTPPDAVTSVDGQTGTVSLSSTYITGNETITLSGDAAESGATSISVTLADSGVTADTYGSASSIPAITVDSKGRITSVTENAVEGLPSQTGNSGKYLTTDGTNASWSSVEAGFNPFLLMGA